MHIFRFESKFNAWESFKSTYVRFVGFEFYNASNPLSIKMSKSDAFYSLLVGSLLDEMHVQNPHPTVVFDAGMQYVCFFVGNNKYLRYPWKLAAGTWKSSQDEVWMRMIFQTSITFLSSSPSVALPFSPATKCPSRVDKPVTCHKKQVPRENMQNPLATVLNVLEKMVDHGISEKIGYQMIQRCTSRLVEYHFCLTKRGRP